MNLIKIFEDDGRVAWADAGDFGEEHVRVLGRDEDERGPYILATAEGVPNPCKLYLVPGLSDAQARRRVFYALLAEYAAARPRPTPREIYEFTQHGDDGFPELSAMQLSRLHEVGFELTKPRRIQHDRGAFGMIVVQQIGTGVLGFIPNGPLAWRSVEELKTHLLCASCGEALGDDPLNLHTEDPPKADGRRGDYKIFHGRCAPRLPG